MEALAAGAGERALFVVLAGLANHDNVGGMFRNAAAFGADAVILDSECCDPLYRKAIRVSVGATLATAVRTARARRRSPRPALAAGFDADRADAGRRDAAVAGAEAAAPGAASSALKARASTRR